MENFKQIPLSVLGIRTVPPNFIHLRYLVYIWKFHAFTNGNNSDVCHKKANLDLRYVIHQ